MVFQLISIEIKGIAHSKKILNEYQDILKKSISKRKPKSLAATTQKKLQANLSKALKNKIVTGVPKRRTTPVEIPISTKEEDAVLTSLVGSIKQEIVGASTKIDTELSVDSSSGANTISDENIKEKLGFKESDTLAAIKRKSNQTSTKFLFDTVFKKIPRLKRSFYKENRIVSFSQVVDGNTRILNLIVPFNKFNGSTYTARIRGDVFRLYLNKKVEAEFKSIIAATQSNTASKVKATRVRLSDGQHMEVLILPNKISNTLLTEAFGLIVGPAVAGVSIKNKEKRKKITRSKFISSIQFSSILQARMDKEMPSGPVGGPALSPVILTNRTRRYLTSVKVAINYRKNLIRYFYNPIYRAHISTPRNPNKQIRRNIRAIAQRLFGREFSVVRGD